MRAGFPVWVLLLGMAVSGVFATGELSRRKRAGGGGGIPDIDTLLGTDSGGSNIDCGSARTYIFINQSFLVARGIEADRLVLTDDDGFTDCVASLMDGAYVFDLRLGECVFATENREVGIATYYKACALRNPGVSDSPVTRADIPTLVMGCHYERDYKTVIGPIHPRLVRFDTHVRPVKFNFEADLLRYTNDNFDTLATDNEIQPGTEVFFKSQMTPTSGFILQGHKCWVQPGDESYDGPAIFKILEDGCPEEDPLSKADPGNVVYTSHTDSKLEFSFQFFTWRHQELSDQDFWVFCELDICPDHENCDTRECDGGMRKKRSISTKSDSKKTVSLGPMRVAKRKASKSPKAKAQKHNKQQKKHQKPPKEEQPIENDDIVQVQLMALQKGKDNVHNSMIALGILGVFLIITSVLVILLMARKRRYRAASKI